MSALSCPPVSVSSLSAFAHEPPPLLPSPDPHTWAAPPPSGYIWAPGPFSARPGHCTFEGGVSELGPELESHP